MKKLIFLAFLFCVQHVIYSQNFEFAHLGTTSGLSSNQIGCIFKDSHGFMWFATNSGLNRYDGTNFKVFKHKQNDPKSSPATPYIDIQGDYLGNLWLRERYGEGYIIYNSHDESFNNTDLLTNKFKLPRSPNIVQIDRDQNYYFYYKNIGIYRYDIKSKTKRLYKQSDTSNGLRLGEITEMKVANHSLWVFYKSGLIERLNETSNTVDYSDTYFQQHDQNSTIAKTFFIDSDNDLWIYPGIEDKGAAYLDTKSYTWNFINTTTKVTLANNLVRGIAEDQNKLIWIATDHGGVNVFEKRNKKMTVLLNNIYDKNSISENSVISIFCGDDGVVWLGSYKKGVSYYHPNMFKFKQSSLFSYYRETPDQFDCNILFKDKHNNLWIGTNGQGLIKYNESTGDHQLFKHDETNPSSISADIITCIKEDHAGIIWVGTYLGGLNAFDGKSFKHYQVEKYNANSLSGKSVYGIAEDANSNLWIGTLGGGLDKLDKDRSKFVQYSTDNTPSLQSNFVLSMFSEASKTPDIYIGFDRGVGLIDGFSTKIKPYFTDQHLASLTRQDISNLFVDSRKLLWLATDQGLYVYNPTTSNLMIITTADGLPSDEIVSVVEDNNHNMWVGTRNGLACLYCSFANSQLKYSINCFDTKDGLPSSVCNQNGMFKDSNGIIYVGSTNGYTCFNPKYIALNNSKLNTSFTELLIDNQVVEPNKKYNNRVILDRSITDLTELKLNYTESNFTVFFSTFNYIHPSKNHYRYKLEGLDKKWTEIKNGRGVASYSNLNPGTYKLIVYTCNENNIWSKKPLVLKITIKPPFWLAWWAFILYTIAVGILIRRFVKYKLNKQNEEFEQAKKLIEVTKTHEVDELKLRFFTNISHEFKTPITLIISPIEKLMKGSLSDEQSKMFAIIHRNALSLLNMVNEILDFRKFDANKMSINFSTGDIIHFVKEICLSFSPLALDSSIKFTFAAFGDTFVMDFDQEKMNKIVTNLLSNAFKYTKKGQIDVTISNYEILDRPTKYIAIKISDTGIGIEEENLQKIFDRFYCVEHQSEVKESGTGVGLHLVEEFVKLQKGEVKVESTVGKGSTFTVIIPVTNLDITESKFQNTVLVDNVEKIDLQNKKTASTHNQGDPILLVVDDNKDFCRFIESLFLDSYSIMVANDGEEASDLVLEHLPDVILCDVMMPKMDGYEFCRKIKEDIRTSHIPVILLTARSSEEHEYMGVEAGADDYISKPFNVDLLKLKISKIVEKQKKTFSNIKTYIDVSPSKIEILTMDEKFVKKAISIVEENMSNSEFLVEDLCREMAMSRVYFYKKILALTDKTPSEFIRFLRLKRAADLLEKSQMFVKEIVFQVGFNDPKYFRKYFKEEFGVTPNEYKKKDQS